MQRKLERQNAFSYALVWLCNKHYQSRDPDFAKEITVSNLQQWSAVGTPHDLTEQTQNALRELLTTGVSHS